MERVLPPVVGRPYRFMGFLSHVCSAFRSRTVASTLSKTSRSWSPAHQRQWVTPLMTANTSSKCPRHFLRLCVPIPRFYGSLAANTGPNRFHQYRAFSWPILIPPFCSRP